MLQGNRRAAEDWMVQGNNVDVDDNKSDVVLVGLRIFQQVLMR